MHITFRGAGPENCQLILGTDWSTPNCIVFGMPREALMQLMPASACLYALFFARIECSCFQHEYSRNGNIELLIVVVVLSLLGKVYV